ncbi:MAG: PEP-CTERM sorting domain-containing protein [Ferribacterium limneticum]
MFDKNIRNALAFGALAAASIGHASAATETYAVAPTWMPMTMLVVSFDTASQKLDVADQSTATNKGPGGIYTSDPIKLGINTDSMGKPDLSATSFASYDPTQPWSVLQNSAFSRQLGWWAGSGTANVALQTNIETAYGTGASIWIESVAQSAGLETYLAVGKSGVNVNNTTTVDPLAGGYSGIFGTDGSSTKWQWDYMMDHNTYAVLLAYLSPNQLYSATYKVYIGDSTGNELAAAAGASTLETWKWQAPAVMPVPEPETYAMFMAGLGLIGFIARRRRAN